MITAAAYTTRRSKLVEAVSHKPLYFTAHDALQARSDMSYPFVQEPTFFYLTGIDEASWELFYDGTEWYLVQPNASEVKQIFDGVLSAARATEISGIDTVIDAKGRDEKLEALLAVSKQVATLGIDPNSKYYDFVSNPAQAKLEDRLRKRGFEVESARDAVRQLRALKQSDEIEIIQRAVDLTTSAFADAKQQLGKFKHEFELEAFFTHAFRSVGADGHAYDPIVAGGAHACTLHYGENSDTLPANGLVLIDIGAKVDGYAADITRTYAIGTPSDREKQIHAAVEAAHKDIVALIKPGLSFEAYQKSVDHIMKAALVSVGILTDGENDQKRYRKYFPHAVGHGLGIDVHESLGGFETFKEGMVLTVEPGIYIVEEGIGVRIEDNILVTPEGNRVLSGNLPTAL